MLQRLKRIARRVVYGRRAPVSDTQELTEPTGPQSDALEFMNSQRIAKNAESLIKRQVTKLDFNSSYLVIEGSAWFEKYPEKDAPACGIHFQIQRLYMHDGRRIPVPGSGQS